MRIAVRVKPHAKQNAITPISLGYFIISVREPPRDSKANEAVRKVVAEYFNVPRSHVRITRGLKAKRKILEIL